MYTNLVWGLDTQSHQSVSFYILSKKTLFFIWVPSHIDIMGNEKADSAADSALNLPHAKVGVPYNDFKHCINQYILSTWQDDWNGAVVNKLCSVKPVLAVLLLEVQEG